MFKDDIEAPWIGDDDYGRDDSITPDDYYDYCEDILMNDLLINEMLEKEDDNND